MFLECTIVAVIVLLWLMSRDQSSVVAVSPVATTGIVDPTVTLMRCPGGIYCDGSFVPDSLSEVGGASICGAGNYLYQCVDSLGTPRWRTDREPCSCAAKVENANL